MMQPVQPQPPSAPNALRAAGDPITNRGPADQRFVIHGVSWRTYAVLREALDAPGLRMTYSEGTLELMSPSTVASGGHCHVVAVHFGNGNGMIAAANPCR